MKVKRASSGSWADNARGFLIFDSSRAESKTQTTRSYPRCFRDICNNLLGLTEVKRLNTSVFVLQNLVCCRRQLSFSTGALDLSTVFLATDRRRFSPDRELYAAKAAANLLARMRL